MIERLQNESFADYKFRLLVEKAKGELDVSWKEVEESLNLGIAHDTLRKGTYFLPEYDEYLKLKLSTTENTEKVQEVFKYKETTEILTDGSTKSDKLIEMSEEQTKDTEFLLKAHGFDSNKWDITNARSSMWNVGSEGKTLYSSKITVKPIKTGIDFEKLVEIMKENVKPVKVTQPTDKGENLLEIPLFDMHWGIADWDYYIPVYEKLMRKIQSKKWDSVLFIIGQDLLHTDGFTGKTTSGTIIGNVDIAQAWEDALRFYSGIIEESLQNSNNVYGYFSNGNHDQAISWAFVKGLAIKYPQVEWDTEMKERKAFIWKDVFIGFTHGDKSPSNRIVGSFMKEFGRDIAKSEIVEIQSGHLHFEESKDNQGIVFRRLSTGAKTDTWHYEKSFVGARKKFQIFEYSSNNLDGISFV